MTIQLTASLGMSVENLLHQTRGCLTGNTGAPPELQIANAVVLFTSSITA